jgi:hypothetical protein
MLSIIILNVVSIMIVTFSFNNVLFLKSFVNSIVFFAYSSMMTITVIGRNMSDVICLSKQDYNLIMVICFI